MKNKKDYLATLVMVAIVGTIFTYQLPAVLWLGLTGSATLIMAIAGVFIYE